MFKLLMFFGVMWAVWQWKHQKQIGRQAVAPMDLSICSVAVEVRGGPWS